MAEVVGVRFKENGKIYYFDPDGKSFPKGKRVIVETVRGIECGEAAVANHTINEDEIVHPLKKVIRAANDDDLKTVEMNKKTEAEAFVFCEKKVVELGLDMKLVEVECTFDGSKMLFYFTSDDRVDFRELVKILAAQYRTRIEMRQIGVRDEIQTVSCRYFVSSVLSQVNATYIENGITMRGMSINGLVYVASEVNGIDMPRTIEGQMQVGSEVELEYDIVTGELLIDSIIPGDLVFLRSPYGTDEDTVYEMAVCTDSGTLMMISTAQTTIRLRNFDADSDIASRIICVRRVFW